MNADAIGGSVGELLSHNIFAYCVNNAVNLEDPSGFRPVSTTEETDEMRRLSLDVMGKTEPANNEIKNRLYRESNAGNKVQNSGGSLKDALVASIPDQAIGLTYSIGETFGEYISVGSIYCKAYSGMWKLPINFGVFENTFKQLGLVGLALSLWGNMDYGIGIGLVRSGIDIVGVLATGGIITAFTLGGGASIALGLGIGLIAEASKWGATTVIKKFQ